MIHNLNENEKLENYINSEKLVIVDFMQVTCGPCIMLEPVLNEISNDFKVDLIVVNIRKHMDEARKLNISGTPTVHFYKKGKLLKSSVGFKPYEEWVKLIENQL
ncbi:MAG: thioredoxin family protein [Metamycoplasmataceae bacterium]